MIIDPSQHSLASVLGDLLGTGDGTQRPYVMEQGERLSLHFGMGAVQSEMAVGEPDKLVLGYTRAMMGYLLLHPAPRRVGMIGLGGGSLAKFCYRHQPDCDITVAEIDADVVALRSRFQIPADDERFRVIVADGASFIQSQADMQLDALLVDGFDASGMPQQLCSEAFYSDCFRRLSDDGVLVMNFLGSDELTQTYIGRVSAAFDGQVAVVKASGSTNRIAFAAKGGWRWAHGPTLQRRARELEAHMPMRFSALASKIAQAAQNRLRDPADATASASEVITCETWQDE